MFNFEIKLTGTEQSEINIKMKKFLQFILLVFCVGFIFLQSGRSQTFRTKTKSDITIADFIAKSEQEQIKLIDGIIKKIGIDASSDVEPTGEKKSAEKLKMHLVLSKLVSSHFLKVQIDELVFSKIDPDATVQIRRYANYLKGKGKSEYLIWNVGVLYFYDEYKKLYAEQSEEWRRKFDSWTNEQQKTYFATKWRQNAKKEFDEIDGIDIALAYLDAEIDYLNKQIKDSDKKIEERKKDIEVADKAIKKLSIYNVVNKLKVSFRASKMNRQRLVLILKNETEDDARFDLTCNIGRSKTRTLPVSLSGNGVKEFGIVKGKGSDFVLGERCEIFVDNIGIRSFIVLNEANKDKSIAGTTWTGESEEEEFLLYDLIFGDEVVRLIFTDTFEEEARVLFELKGEYRKAGNTIYMDFPSVMLEATIKGTEMDVSLTYKKDNSKETWKAKKEENK